MKTKILYTLFGVFCIFQASRVDSGFLSSKIYKANWQSYYQNQIQTRFKLKEKESYKGMINVKQLKHLIDETLENIDLYSQAASQLVLGTIVKESFIGGNTYLHQKGGGPAVGIGQVEPTTEEYIWQWLDCNLDLRNKVVATTKINGPNPYHLKGNLIYNIVMVRLKYRTISAPLPEYNNILGQANYWKKYYNTELGKGTADEYLNAWDTYVKGV